MSKSNLLIAFGGVSPEHEVSVITGIQAASALEQSDYNLIPLYISKSGTMLTGSHLLDLGSYEDLKKTEQNAAPCTFYRNQYGRTVLQEMESGGLFSKPKNYPIDAVLVAFHGSDGENGSFQGLCETFNLPYTGSGPMASAVGMDKRAAKMFAKAVGIPVAKDVFLTEELWVKDKSYYLRKIMEMGTPVFVKPVHLGSSIGVARAVSESEIELAIENGFRYDDQLLIEKAVHPLTEVNCAVLGDTGKAKASVCEQPLGREELLSFEDKYMGDEGKGMASATRKIPAPISDELTANIQDYAVRFFQAIDANGVARLDFLVNKDTEEVYFNEINTIPGSFSFYLWDKTDLPFPDLLNRLIDLGLKRHKLKNGRVRSYDTNLLSQKAVKGIKGLKGKG